MSIMILGFWNEARFIFHPSPSPFIRSREGVRPSKDCKNAD